MISHYEITIKPPLNQHPPRFLPIFPCPHRCPGLASSCLALVDAMTASAAMTKKSAKDTSRQY